VLHAAKSEPLGRIFLEAIDYNLPLVGYASGGIGEIAKQIGYTDTLCAHDASPQDILDKLSQIETMSQQQPNWIQAKELAKNIFSIQKYCNNLDILLNDNLVSQQFPNA